jgi:hypothetical protein
LPSDEVTPPVMNMYFVEPKIFNFPDLFKV